jgi:hypothetical protein
VTTTVSDKHSLNQISMALALYNSPAGQRTPNAGAEALAANPRCAQSMLVVVPDGRSFVKPNRAQQTAKVRTLEFARKRLTNSKINRDTATLS